MEVFRIAHQRFAKLDGIGGVYHNGRWHHAGQPIIYSAGSRSLSMLERYIHEEGAGTLPQLVMLSIFIPDETHVDNISVADLKHDWYSNDDTVQIYTRQIGDEWLSSQRTSVLKVPSAIVPQEYNYLINPLLIERDQIKIIDKRAYNYEQRYTQLISPLPGSH